ncbi:MAG: cyclic nucleotide-binding domain-containing protein [Alphaproteobacteria bacterium]
MNGLIELAAVALVGFFTTASSLLGAAIGLYVAFPRRALAAILAFAAGALISALAIELAFAGAEELRRQAFGVQFAWAFIGGGFAMGATAYYWMTLFLERKGAAVRLPTRFREYAIGRKQEESRELISLLSKCDLLRHFPPDRIEALLPRIRQKTLAPGDILFRAGVPGDALYIVARGAVQVLAASTHADGSAPIATLGPGQVFGEMALLTGGPRTATIRASEEARLLEIGKAEFDELVSSDREFAGAVQKLSHQRAITNLSAGSADPGLWARIARSSVEQMSRSEADNLLAQTGQGAGLVIVLSNILDTLPGCLVIGARFSGMESLSLTLMLGMFLGNIPEAAASGAMMKKANYSARAIFGLWSIVVVAGIAGAVAGHQFIGSSVSLMAIFAQAIAGGAVLACVVHAMIPEAIHEGGSVVVLPTVGGFLFALYLALSESFA